MTLIENYPVVTNSLIPTNNNCIHILYLFAIASRQFFPVFEFVCNVCIVVIGCYNLIQINVSSAISHLHLLWRTHYTITSCYAQPNALKCLLTGYNTSTRRKPNMFIFHRNQISQNFDHFVIAKSQLFCRSTRQSECFESNSIMQTEQCTALYSSIDTDLIRPHSSNTKQISCL